MAYLKQSAMRTLEFRLYPNSSQAAQLEAWLELHRRIWNYGLALLQELDQFSAYDKVSKERVPCCPVPWSYRWQKAEDERWHAIPYSEVRRFRDGGLCCPIDAGRTAEANAKPYLTPKLPNDSYFSIATFFAKKNHSNWSELKACPSNLIRGTLGALGVAWKEYKSGKKDSMGRTRKAPRFKGQRFWNDATAQPPDHAC